MTKEKAYFEKIKKRIEPLKDVVYYEAINEDEILELEKEWKVSFKPIVREFLMNFGFTQDVIKNLQIDKEDMKDNLDWLRESKLNNYLPIKTKLTAERNLVIAMNNDDKEDYYLYEIDLETSDKSKIIRRRKRTFTEIIDRGLSKISVKKRCKNINKINSTEFRIEALNNQDFLSILEDSKIKQITEWRDKYYPENIFGTKMAKFEMFEKIRLLIERDETGTEYKFSIEESILLDKKESLILKMERLLKKNNLEFKQFDCNLIETE